MKNEISANELVVRLEQQLTYETACRLALEAEVERLRGGLRMVLDSLYPSHRASAPESVLRKVEYFARWGLGESPKVDSV